MWLLDVVQRRDAQFLRARSLQLTDFEDAALASAAVASGCELIITRNVPDFSSSPVPAITPEESLLAG
jgi:hypothetical protein